VAATASSRRLFDRSPAFLGVIREGLIALGLPAERFRQELFEMR
jgi:hypothetical protein